MARCQLFNEDECIGHDCINRIGTPCIYDIHGQAGTEDMVTDDHDDCDGDCDDCPLTVDISMN
jgi:hypothetical protein